MALERDYRKWLNINYRLFVAGSDVPSPASPAFPMNRFRVAALCVKLLDGDTIIPVLPCFTAVSGVPVLTAETQRKFLSRILCACSATRHGVEIWMIEN